MSIKISKISYFSFNFKFSEKKVLLKKYGLGKGEGGYKKIFARRGLIFNRGLEIFQKKGTLRHERGGEQITVGSDPQRNYAKALARRYYNSYASTNLAKGSKEVTSKKKIKL